MVIHGDSLELIKNLADNSVDCVITDPPYGQKWKSGTRLKKKFIIPNIKNDDNSDLFVGIIPDLFRVMRENTHLYVFCNDFAYGKWRNEISNAGFTTKRTLIWVKNNSSCGDLSGDYGCKSEFIIFACKGVRKLNGRRDDNILNFSRVRSDIHPTVKPVDLLSYLVKKSTNEGDLLLDPFSGTGSLGQACKSTGRSFIGYEIENHYAEISNQLINNTPSPLFI